MVGLLKIALVSALLFAACGFDPGPTTPDGANAVDVKFVAAGFYGCGYAPVVLAANSVTDLRGSVQAWCRGQPTCAHDYGACWQGVADDSTKVYVAVMTANECNRPVKEETLIAGHTLYFIHWIGRSAGVCNAAMAQPALRLYAIDRSDLPRSGKLKVELQIQDVQNGTSVYDAAVDLG